ncbi:MAG: ATP-binding cassette domain-containing protein [Verrucomicrobia bacterium]|nr:ATP-binding cassette domain-containing protein [Lachnospiraceae bacterium]MBR4250345.1 ATP-binding cassette domain-containing protein [Verrucomicrobiota bacterium]
MKLECKNALVHPSGKEDEFVLGPINLSIEPGLITGLVGRNGSGKTTLLRLLSGRLMPEEGSVQTGEGRISYVGGKMGDWLIRKPDSLADAVAVFEPWFDKPFLETRMRRLGLQMDEEPDSFTSAGKKMYLLLFELARKPDILLLDEPTSGLPPAMRHEALDLLQEYMEDEKHSLVFSTHITADLDRVADRIVLLDDGQIRLDEEKEAVKLRMRVPGEALPSIAEIMGRFSGQ